MHLPSQLPKKFIFLLNHRFDFFDPYTPLPLTRVVKAANRNSKCPFCPSYSGPHVSSSPSFPLAVLHHSLLGCAASHHHARPSAAAVPRALVGGGGGACTRLEVLGGERRRPRRAGGGTHLERPQRAGLVRQRGRGYDGCAAGSYRVAQRHHPLLELGNMPSCPPWISTAPSVPPTQGQRLKCPNS